MSRRRIADLMLKVRLPTRRLRTVSMFALGIFLFICSLEGVKAGFKLVFSEWQAGLLSLIGAATAPVAGLAVGVLVTSVVQSSSAVVAATMVTMSGMVQGGLPLASAIRFGIPMVYGANIGTTITNTLVALGVKRGMKRGEFRLTIPGVIVDDIYKILNISLFFAIELATGLMGNIALTLKDFAVGFLKTEEFFAAFERSVIDIIVKEPIVEPTTRWFTLLLGGRSAGILVFAIWFVVVVLSLGLMTKHLENLIEGEWEERMTAAFRSPLRGFLTGFSITWIVGSSSVGTSLIIPFLATRVVDLRGAYPYLGGCTLATTMDLSQIYGYIAGGTVGLILGSAHVVLNVFGVLIWYLSPLRILPVRLAELLGGLIASSRQGALGLVLWALIVFFALPAMVLLLVGVF